jgi:hypothetical protein
VKVRWKAVTSELSYWNHQRKLHDIFKRTYISELNLPQLSQCIHNLPADFVGDVELDHAHIRRAEHGILMVHHGEEDWELSQILLRWFVMASLNVPGEDGDCVEGVDAEGTKIRLVVMKLAFTRVWIT